MGTADELIQKPDLVTRVLEKLLQDLGLEPWVCVKGRPPALKEF